jgi:SAM-dependent methyltransferase
MIRNEADMAYRRRVQTIFDWLEPAEDDLILDGGCGRGFYVRFIRHASKASIIGLELELPFLQIARSALTEFSEPPLVNASLYDVPFAPDSFDKVILSEVLEHVPDDVGALRSVARAIKPGGLIAITVPNANYPFWWDPINRTLEALLHTHLNRGPLAGIWANHIRLYTEEQLQTTVRDAGLSILAMRRFTHHSFPFIHNVVYGFGKTILEAGLLPSDLQNAANRHNLNGERSGYLNPIHIGLRIFEWFDGKNTMDEPPGTSTVNLCILAQRPPE